jgi:hypothetical protein
VKRLQLILFILITSLYGEKNNTNVFSNEQICSEFSSLFTHNQKSKFSNPSRSPTEQEVKLINEANL